MAPTSPVDKITIVLPPREPVATADTSTSARHTAPPRGSSEILPRSASPPSSSYEPPPIVPRNADALERFRNVALQSLTRKQRAQVRWSQLAAHVPEMVERQRCQVGRTQLAAEESELIEQQRVERATHLALAQTMIDTGELKQPRAFEGQVTRGLDGMLTSTDKAVAAILAYAQAKDPGALNDLAIDESCTLSLPLEANILLQARLFARGCAVRQLSLSDSTTSEVDIYMSTYATREAIKKGTHGFQSTAQMTYADPTLRRLSDDQHPFAFLQGVRFQVESSSPDLQRVIERCLNDNDPTTLELRGRLGAQAVKSVFSQKQVTKETWIALGLSLTVSAVVATALDIFAWGTVNKHMGQRFGKDDPRTRFAAVMLASLTPGYAQTVDSFGVGRLIEKLRGGSFRPESLSDAWDTLKNCLISGASASLGSVSNNALALTKKWAFQPLTFLTNMVAVTTSHAMIPLEVNKAHEKITAGVIQHMNDGFFPVPELPGAEGMTEEHLHKAFAKQVKRATEPALDVAPGDGLAINSMGVVSLVSQMAFLPIDALTRIGKLNDVVKSIVSILINTPTEAISMAIGNTTGRWLGGIGNAMTTDGEKDRLIMALIANKAIQRIRAPDANHPDAGVEITEAELKAIEHPKLELTFKAGKLMTKLMNGTVHLVSDLVGVLRRQPPQTLSEKVDISRLRNQAPNDTFACASSNSA
jgi:hypothetical protein